MARATILSELIFQRVAEPREVFIQGVTKSGKAFRPSDWAERLAGTMSCFRPDGGSGGRVIGYSPYCVPRHLDNDLVVVADPAAD